MLSIVKLPLYNVIIEEDFKMKDNRKVLYVLVAIALILSVAGISIGFAAMSQELTINGQAEVTPATWKIKFTNLGTPQITGDASVATTPTLTDTHFGNYDVVLTKPGDSVVYTFDVKNAGTLDAKLTAYNFATPTFTGTGTNAAADATIAQTNVVYTLTYSDGSAIGVNDTLAAGESKTLRLTVEYPATATTLPEAEVDITGMDVTFTYSQD